MPGDGGKQQGLARPAGFGDTTQLGLPDSWPRNELRRVSPIR